MTQKSQSSWQMLNFREKIKAFTEKETMITQVTEKGRYKQDR